MRTTVELPDDLFRQTKARAAIEGRPVKELVAEGLKLLLRIPAGDTPATYRTAFPIIKAKDPSRKVTVKMITEAEEQLLAEEAAAQGHAAGH